MNIDEMQAGREIDTLLAKKIQSGEIDMPLVKKIQKCACSFSIEEWMSDASPILQGAFTIFIENGIEPGAAIGILDEEQQKYYQAKLTRFDDDGIDFEILDLESK